MSSSSSGKCPLCFTKVLVKNFKRHCDTRHNSVDTKEKYEKLLKKLKETITNQHQQLPTSNLTTVNEPFTPTSNETSPDGTESELDILYVLANNEYPLPVDALHDENTSLDGYQNIIQIKNNICGQIQFILNQIQLASKVTDMAFDETVSAKSFLIETASSFGKIKESLSDLLGLCDASLEKIPSLSTTIDKLKSSETIISREPSTTRVYNEVELRYLVHQGPYQPILAHYPVNEN